MVVTACCWVSQRVFMPCVTNKLRSSPLHPYVCPVASGVAQLASDYVTVCTAEGDRIILELQCARFLMNTADTLQKTSSTASLSDVCGYLSPLASVTASAGTTLPFTTDSDGFVSLPSLMALFKQRALSSVRSTRAKLNQCLQANSGLHNSFDVSWNACALQLVDVSRHHCWSIIMRYV